MFFPPKFFGVALSFAFLLLLAPSAAANGNVYVSRFWHNHQPNYWPEWNSNGSQNSRVQYAWDSIVLKPGQNYGGISSAQHPENNLTDIFGLDDRKNAYQGGPRNSLTTFNSAGGFAISYSGALIDNVRQLASVGQLGYGGGWNGGNSEAMNWRTPAGGRRLDLVGFTYHHSLAPLLPKSVFRKELQIFKQAWWKAWGGNSNLSDHSKGYFPTEMAYSQHMIDVLADEGYEWLIVASHHISRTCPTYNTKANPAASFNIFSSPPNKADQTGPSPTTGWWYGEPNPGNAAWNVAPYAYQLHKVKYVNPDTGAEKMMLAVPSDDVLSYRYGYSNEGIGKISEFISPFANDPNRPVIVMPSTDGDNAWGGGSSSWFEATPQLFNGAASAGYKPSTPQDFVNAHGAAAPVAHIEDGAWIFPESDYGSPYFLKWIEPPVANVAISATNRVPGTQVDMETPGFALKFFSYAPLMAGANWCETAEQILKEEGGSVEAWKIQAPYDWNGAWTGPNDVELGWHIYLNGLDSGFNYYGGLGNDDEVKPALATKRAIEKLASFMSTRMHKDKTPPTVLKPQRFPYNPGGYTFGWFNRIPGGDTNYLKKMGSDFYIWTHAYDVAGIPDGNVKVKMRVDNDGANPIGSNQNETFAGGGEVGSWITLMMNKRTLPKTRSALNTAASNGQIDYFVFDPAFWTNPQIADYYFAKITNTNVPDFRGKLLDYYIEATDALGNVSKSDIQHVFVEDDSSGGGPTPTPEPGGVVTAEPVAPVVGSPVTIIYNPAGRVLATTNPVYIHLGRNGWQNRVTPRPAMTLQDGKWRYTLTPAEGTTVMDIVLTANAENASGGAWDNNGGADWHLAVSTAQPNTPPTTPNGFTAAATSHTAISLNWNPSATATGYEITRNGLFLSNATDNVFADTGLQSETAYSYTVSATNAAGASALSAIVTGTTLFTPLSATAMRIVSPSAPAQVASGTYVFTGHAGPGLVNGLTWSNPANGLSGTIPYPGQSTTSGWSWSQAIPLASGSNVVTFAATYATSGTLVSGSDSATNYSIWNHGSSGGTGFGSWTLTGTGSAGHFLADAPANMNVGILKGFGMWAMGGGSSYAKRNLPATMETGDVLSVPIDNNYIQNGSGISVALADASGTNRFALRFVGGELTYRIDDATANLNSSVAYTSNGLTLTFTLTGSNTYNLTTGASALSGTLAGGGGISQIVFTNNNAGPGTDYNFYIGGLTFTEFVNTSGTTQLAAPAVAFGGITDGLPDSWWNQFFGTTSGMSATTDSDGDGLNNGQEFILGTHPLNAASTFRVSEITRTGDTIQISWASVPGKSYRAQYRASLTAGDWIDAGSVMTADSNSASTQVSVPPASDKYFVRVILAMP